MRVAVCLWIATALDVMANERYAAAHQHFAGRNLDTTTAVVIAILAAPVITFGAYMVYMALFRGKAR